MIPNIYNNSIIKIFPLLSKHVKQCEPINDDFTELLKQIHIHYIIHREFIY